jgi:hypothetical protein
MTEWKFSFIDEGHTVVLLYNSYSQKNLPQASICGELSVGKKIYFIAFICASSSNKNLFHVCGFNGDNFRDFWG